MKTRALYKFAFVVGLSLAAGVSRGQEATATAGAATVPATTKKAHDPKVWEKEIAAFEEADRKKMPAPGGVLFVGSSSIRLWKLDEAFPGKNVLNRGFGGSHSGDSVYYADRIVLPYKPKTIVFYAGENDIAAGKSADDVLAAVKAFVGKVRPMLPQTKFAFIGLKPSPSRWKMIDEFRRANELVRQYLATLPDTEFISVEAEMLGSDGKPREELFRPDKLHMLSAGYEIWNGKVRHLVE